MKVQIERINSVAVLERLEKEWTGLLDQCPQRELYLTHDWMVRWCRYFSKEENLYILLIKEDSHLIGIAPLILARERVRGVPVRELRFLLNGCSVRSNLIVPPANAKKAFSSLVGYFREIANQWDLIRLHGMSEQSGTLCGLQEALIQENGFHCLPPISWDNSIIPLEGDWESYLKSRSRHFRKRLGVTERDLDKMGKVTLTCYKDPQEVDLAMEKIFDIEKRSWKVERGDAFSTQEDSRAFYLDIARTYAEKGAWRAWLLEVDGKPVASHFGFSYGGTFYSEKQSYDAAYAVISPGKAVFRFVVEDSFREKAVREIDLDNKTHFSDHWADVARRYHEIQIFSRRPYSMLLWGMKRHLYPLLMKGSALLRRKGG